MFSMLYLVRCYGTNTSAEYLRKTALDYVRNSLLINQLIIMYIVLHYFPLHI